jgi:hypothetical protein
MPTSQRIVQVCLFLFAAIALTGGTLQLYMGQPETTPRLDNIHRFLAGIYLGCGFIVLWAAITVRQQGTLIYLIALTVLIAGLGRGSSMLIVGVPQPAAAFYGYLVPELILPIVMAIAHRASRSASG